MNYLQSIGITVLIAALAALTIGIIWSLPKLVRLRLSVKLKQCELRGPELAGHRSGTPRFLFNAFRMSVHSTVLMSAGCAILLLWRFRGLGLSDTFRSVAFVVFSVAALRPTFVNLRDIVKYGRGVDDACNSASQSVRHE
jgi:hypothetical protein